MMTAASYGSSTANANSDDGITIENIVQSSEFSGLDLCRRKGLVAARVDQASISENRTYHDWVIIEWPSGKVRLKVDAGETLNSFGQFENVRPQWSADCQWIYYRARKYGEVQVWRLNARSGKTEKVTSDGADVLSFQLSESRRELIYKTSAERSAISAAETHEYEHGVLYDESIYTLHPPLMRTFPIAGRWSVARRPYPGVGGHLLSQQPLTYKIVSTRDFHTRLATETEKAALPREELGGSNWVAIENEGTSVSLTGDRAAVKKITKQFRYSSGAIATRLISIRRETPEKMQECTDPRCEGENVDFLKWSEDGSTIYFINEPTRGAAGIYAWTPESEEVRTVLRTEGTLGALASAERYKSMPCSIIGENAFCTAADHGSPPKLLAIDLRSGKTKTVLDPNRSLRQKFRLKTERIRWKDTYKREALGIIVYPRNFKVGNRYPLVITTYKCRGFLNGGIADGGPEYALAEGGFLVLCIDFNFDLPPIEETIRFSPGPGRFVTALSEYESAIDMLADRGLIDRARVGITGISMSANAVSYALTHSGYFASAATRSLGVISPERAILFAHPLSEWHTTMLRVFNMGSNKRNSEVVYDHLAVTRRADCVKTPILVQASESEYLISLPAVHALLKRKKAVEMHIFPDETHFLHQPIHRFVNFTRNLDWFRFWLQDYEDPDPEKAKQYARWRKMREEQCVQLKGQDNAPWYCRH